MSKLFDDMILLQEKFNNLPASARAHPDCQQVMRQMRGLENGYLNYAWKNRELTLAEHLVTLGCGFSHTDTSYMGPQKDSIMKLVNKITFEAGTLTNANNP